MKEKRTNSKKVDELNYSRDEYIMENMKGQIGNRSSYRKSNYVVAKRQYLLNVIQ